MMMAASNMSEVSTLTGKGRDREHHGRVLLVVCDGRTTEHPLPESGVCVIGRGGSADIVIDHPTLSRSHAKLTIGAHVTVQDCGSRNGTLLNGKKLEATEVVLALPGSPIELGDALLILRSGARGDISPSASSDGTLGTGATLDRMIGRVADAEAPVLIVGEAGAGKMFVANQLHARSQSRRAGPFITLRCASLKDPRDISAAAIAARGGVLVVHEPSTLSLDAQLLLSATLDADGGSFRTITITTRDLATLASRGAFMGELVHRLSVITLVVPALRARLRELPAIAETLVTQAAAENNRPAPLLSADALSALGRHAWPGNVRELKNALTRAVLLGSGRVLTAAHFDLDAANQAAGAGAGTLSSAVSEAEHRRILEALRQCNGNQTRAAKMLGISRGTLISRLERYAVPRPRK